MHSFIRTGHSVQHANLGQKWPQISGSTVVRDRHREPTGQRARARWNRLAIPLRMPRSATAAASSLSSSTTAAQDASDPMFAGDLHPHDQVKGNTSPRNCDSRILGGGGKEVWDPWDWHPALVGQRQVGGPKHALTANKGKTFCRLKPKVGDGLTRPKNKTKQDGNMFCIMITNKMHLQGGKCLSVH